VKLQAEQLNHNRGIGWIGIILSLMKEQDQNIKFVFSQDHRYEEFIYLFCLFCLFCLLLSSICRYKN
jgi:hypothetical protein